MNCMKKVYSNRKAVEQKKKIMTEKPKICLCVSCMTKKATKKIGLTKINKKASSLISQGTEKIVCNFDVSFKNKKSEKR